jgi:hypothetical protein
MIKKLALAACLSLCVTVLGPSLRSGQASAQGPRPFRDSWFWGAYGGLASYTPVNSIDPSAPGTSSMAAQVGGDWLITRKSGGLYLGFGQSFVTSQGAVLNGPTSADTGFRIVDVKSLRRVNLAAMIYPGGYVRMHPYFGFGVAFDYLGAAQPIFTTADGPKQEDYAQSAVSEVKAALGPLFLAGVQYRALSAVSVFGQFTAAAMSKDFLLSNGNPISMGFQLGLRYNLGPSVDKGY